MHKGIGCRQKWVYVASSQLSTVSPTLLDVHKLGAEIGVCISQLVRLAWCCTSVLDFNSKNLQLTSKLFTQGYRYYKLRKTLGKFFRSYSDLLS